MEQSFQCVFVPALASIWRLTIFQIHADAGSSLFDPIKDRLRSRDTILRQTVDPSLLVESLLDLVVDEALDIVDKYQEKIAKLEGSILSRAKMRLVRALHIISGDLALLKRSLDPIKSLVFGLRRYDLDRCIAVAASQDPGKDPKEPASPPVGFMCNVLSFACSSSAHLLYSPQVENLSC